MEFKRVKMLSGMLSAAAIASLTGIPVLADTAAVDGPSLTNTLENGQDEESTDESSIDVLTESLQNYEAATKDQFFSVDVTALGSTSDAAEEAAEEETETAEEESDLMIPMAADTEDVSQDVSDPFEDAVQEYNKAVLPRLTVALNEDKSANHVLNEQAAVEAPAVEKQENTAPALKDEAEGRKIVIASPNVYLNIHAEPAMSSEVLGKMYSNDLAIELRKEDDRWTKIRSGNVVGYVMNEYLVDGTEAEALSEMVSKQVATVNEKGDPTV